MPTWELTYQPLNIRLAAHPRAVATDYTNDHVWDMAWGQSADEPMISAQTRYNGRVGLVRLVPVIRVNNASVYTVGEVQSTPNIQLMTPDSSILEFSPWGENIHMRMLWRVLDSQTLIGRFHLVNKARKTQTVDIQLFLQGMSGKQTLAIHQLEVAIPTGTMPALTIKNIQQISPVLVFQNAQATNLAALNSTLTLKGKAEQTLKWVLVSQPELDQSLKTAYEVLNRNWATELQVLPKQASAFPEVTLGQDNAAIEAAIALSANAIGQHIISASGKLPHPFPLTSRTTSTSTKSLKHGQALEIYQYISSLAVLDPALAQGVLRNYFKLQHKDGWIDGIIGPEGEAAAYLMLPILAQMTQIVDFYANDRNFLIEAFPKLLSFYQYWFHKQDADQDGFPEWQSVHQSNYEYHPLSSLSIREAPPIDIRMLESPDLAVYLLQEGAALEAIAKKLGKKARDLWGKLEPYHKKLAESLQLSWQGDKFSYRDRDSNLVFEGEKLASLKGDEQLDTPITLVSPSRVIVLVEGSQTAPPANLAITLEGLDATGQPITETLTRDQFVWHRSHYAATSQNIWQAIHRTQITGLSRVYKYMLESVDLSRRDITLLLPYVWNGLPNKQREAIYADLQEHYQQAFGLSSLPKTDPSYSRTDSNGRHVVMPWMMMFGLAMLDHKQAHTSAELFKALSNGIAQTLTQQGGFFQWYNAEDGTGLGLINHIVGAVPLHWLVQLMGVYVRNEGEVEVFRNLAFEEDLQIKWHGVLITRNTQLVKIQFPSGKTVTLEAEAEAQTVLDPKYEPLPPAPLPVVSSPTAPSPRTIQIKLEQALPDDDLWSEKD